MYLISGLNFLLITLEIKILTSKYHLKHLIQDWFEFKKLIICKKYNKFLITKHQQYRLPIISLAYKWENFNLFFVSVFAM